MASTLEHTVEELETQVSDILASRPGALADPFPVWRRLREEAPLLRTDDTLLVARHADVRTLLRASDELGNRSAFEGSRADAIRARLSERQREHHDDISDFEQRYVSRSDDDQHKRLRNVAHRAFTPRRVAEMATLVRRYAEELIVPLASEPEATGLLELHRAPAEWARLADDPALGAAGTEELLRFVSPTQWVQRVARRPLSVASEQILPGETVLLAVAAANRDPAVFADAETLDLGRADARQHLALGFGPHFRLGNALARLEGQVTFGLLAERFPRMEVQTEGLAWTGHGKLRRLETLPIRLEPRPGRSDHTKTTTREMQA